VRSDTENVTVAATRKLNIDLSDYESEVLEAVLSFMYLDHYAAGEMDGVVFHTKVSITACKFEMSGLRDLAVVKYQDAVKNFEQGWEKQYCTLIVTPTFTPLALTQYNTHDTTKDGDLPRVALQKGLLESVTFKINYHLLMQVTTDTIVVDPNWEEETPEKRRREDTGSYESTMNLCCFENLPPLQNLNTTVTVSQKPTPRYSSSVGFVRVQPKFLRQRLCWLGEILCDRFVVVVGVGNISVRLGGDVDVCSLFRTIFGVRPSKECFIPGKVL
jgi:hypothetical protein